ncbi:MAG: hypothetical protein ABJM43_03510 [Paracoccaceae bacterium]
MRLLLRAAVYLADQEFYYWIECGEARMGIGNLKAAQVAFEKASELTVEEPDGREVNVYLPTSPNFL